MSYPGGIAFSQRVAPDGTQRAIWGIPLPPAFLTPVAGPFRRFSYLKAGHWGLLSLDREVDNEVDMRLPIGRWSRAA